MPASPATFTFTATYGAGLGGTQMIGGLLAIFRPTTGERVERTAPSLALTAGAGGGDPVTPTAPVIGSQPVGVTVNEGESFALTVIASGTAPVTYQWRKDGLPLAGATASTYTVTAATVAAAGTYTVTVSNSAGVVTSSGAAVAVKARAAVPTIVTPPRNHSGPTGTPYTLTVTAAGEAPLAYQWRKDGAALPGATAAALTLAGAAADSGSYAVTVSNAAGATTSTAATVLFAAATGGPTILQPPASVTAAPGETVVLRVTATGPAPLTYQWFKDGTALAGRTGSELTLAGVAAADAGSYTVAVTAGGSRVEAGPARVTVAAGTVRPGPPVIVRQPTATVALAGSAAVLTVTATGAPAPAYQWRRNGTPVAGATAATLTLPAVQAAEAGGYDVVVRNASGETTSSLATLTVVTAPVAPTIGRQPGSVTVVAGRTATLAAAATGAPAPTYQWFKDGTAVAGATTATLMLADATAAVAGTYTLRAANAAGTVTSQPATVRVAARSFAGAYFGELGGGGNFALHVRDDNSGIFLAYAPATRIAYAGGSASVDDNGNFRFGAASFGAAPARAAAAAPDGSAAPAVAAAGDVTVEGTVTTGGAISGRASGAGTFTLAGTRATGGTTADVAGYFEASAAGGTARLLAIVGPDGRAFAVTLGGAAADGGLGTVTPNGRILLATAASQTVVLETSAATGTVTGSATSPGGATMNFAGVVENSAAAAAQRLVNVSTRTTAGTGDQVAIVGFVIGGLEAKPVLIRAIGPALGAFGVEGALAAPRLQLVREGTTLATNAGWSTGGGAIEIAAAATRAGGFALAANSADSALLTTLAPGAYSAIVAAADGRPGIGLVEVYDLSGASADQRLLNLSTRAVAGAGEATLISGFVVGGSAPKRVLVRAAGPALTAFGVGGVLARPVLRIFSGDTPIAQNSGWSGGPEAATVADAAASAGAFAFGAGSADAAIIIALAPGAYSAQVSAADGSTGIVLLEVYELR